MRKVLEFYKICSEKAQLPIPIGALSATRSRMYFDPNEEILVTTIIDIYRPTCMLRSKIVVGHLLYRYSTAENVFKWFVLVNIFNSTISVTFKEKLALNKYLVRFYTLQDRSEILNETFAVTLLDKISLIGWRFWKEHAPNSLCKKTCLAKTVD